MSSFVGEGIQIWPALYINDLNFRVFFPFILITLYREILKILIMSLKLFVRVFQMQDNCTIALIVYKKKIQEKEKVSV